MFEASKWIWRSKEAKADEYCEFFTEFEAADMEQIHCRLSCDSDYTLFVNGSFAASNQYGDFEHYKVYDEIDITPFVKRGKNTLSVLVWYFGENTSRYKTYAAGLIFEVVDKNGILTASSQKTLARLSPAYQSHRCKKISSQLGYGFHYNASREDGALFSGAGFVNAAEVEKNCVFHKRIGEKLIIADTEKTAKITVAADRKYHLVDFGEETLGLLTLRFCSKQVQTVRIDWGEDLQNGHVRRIIGADDFSVEYTAKAGKNRYTNYMLRFGCRYLEVWTEEPITVDYIGIIPQYYPAIKKQVCLEDPLDQKIYDMCVNTLSLSMLEHYVDCPWREQALYVYDARNQMLSGYFAFESGNQEYAYSNLMLISQDRRTDGLLSICTPTGKPNAIPTFSLHYFTAVLEYYRYTQDKAFLQYVYPKLLSVIKPFRDNSENGLVYSFGGEGYWNFYDWSDYLDGWMERGSPRELHSVINFLYIIALDALEEITRIIDVPFLYGGEADAVRKRVKTVFFCEADGLFSFKPSQKDYTELANALAIVSKTVNGTQAEAICQKLLSGAVSESSLSLKCFMYDALLMTDVNYKDAVLSQIRKHYGYMLSCGATTAWETIKGAEDFGNSGSLCHGWSAIPVYYYHQFGMTKSD